MLAAVESNTMTNTWFRDFARAHAEGAEVDVEGVMLSAGEPGGDELEGERSSEALTDIVGPSVGALVAPVAAASGWGRSIVDMGEGTLQVRVYFDHFSHSSGHQRGWVVCSSHGCIRYAACTGSKESYCAAMYLWHQAGGALVSKAEHLAHEVGMTRFLLPCIQFACPTFEHSPLACWKSDSAAFSAVGSVRPRTVGGDDCLHVELVFAPQHVCAHGFVVAATLRKPSGGRGKVSTEVHVCDDYISWSRHELVEIVGRIA